MTNEEAFASFDGMLMNRFTLSFINENTKRLKILFWNYERMSNGDIMHCLDDHCVYASSLPFRPATGGIRLDKGVEMQEKYPSFIYAGKLAWFLDSEECALYILTEYE